MKSDLKAKLLQHLSSKKKGNSGFTLIELLVVIIIIGILSAIALPSFLNQANKAKQSEARTYVGSMNRAQQAYYLENNSFADNPNFTRLGLGISTDTKNYSYAIAGSGSTVTNQAQTKDAAAAVKAYVGGVKVGQVTSGTVSEATTVAILCEGNNAPVISAALNGTQAATYNAPTVAMACPANYTPLN